MKKVDDVISASRYGMMMLRFAKTKRDAELALLALGQQRRTGPATKGGY